MKNNDIITRIKAVRIVGMVFFIICEIGVIAVGIKEFTEFISIYSDIMDVGIGVSVLYFLPFLFISILIIILMIVIIKMSGNYIRKYQ